LVTDGQTGLLFPIGQAEGLADQLEKVARRPEWAEALGRNARRTIVEQFDIHALLERETDLLADLARSNRRLQKSRPL
jgi:glycosyltransferase involved in cell wall biosynthesis